MLKKPNWFTWIDLLTFVGTGVVIAGIATYAAIVGVEGVHAIQGLILTFVVALSFIAFFAVHAYDRKKWLDTFIWYPKYGFMVHAEDGWRAPDEKTFDDEVETTIEAWAPLVQDARSVVMSDIKWVTFRKNFDETDRNPAKKKVNGVTIAGSHTFGVDIDSVDDNIKKTAFSHELGHVILGNSTHNWDEEFHHKYMKEHGLR